MKRVSERGSERIAMHGSDPLVSASDSNEFGVQRWSEYLPVPCLLVPLIIEGDQQASTESSPRLAAGFALG